MRRTPSGDEEQYKYTPRPRMQRPQRIQRSPQSPQRRKNVAEPKKQEPINYYSDEYPGVPKVRRASRLPDERQPQPSYTARLPIVELLEDEQDEDPTFPIQRSTGKIMVSPRRRPPVYEPPDSEQPHPQRPPRPQYPQRPQGQPRPHAQYVRSGRHEKRRQPRSLLTTLQDFSHNRTFVVLAVVSLLAVIILPFLVNGIINSAHNATDTVSGVGQGSSGGPATIGQPSANAHEIVITPPESDHPAPPVLATSAYLLDADTGATLYAHNPFVHLPMMSTTKLMTAVLAVEQGNLDRNVTITGAINNDLGQLSADSSLMGIKKGETYSLRELLYGLLLVSGNDAAIAIGDTVGGNLPHFITLMNQRANQLGLQDTHYMNPHGLLATEHFSSAHDLAVLGRYAMNLQQLHQISGTRTYDVPKNGSHPDHYLINGNQFLWWYPGVDGGKPGWDGGANFVQVVSCVRNGHHLIGVTMHTSDWWTDMRDLMNWGFNSFSWVSPYDVDFRQPIPYDNQWGYFTRDKKDVAIPTADQGRYYIYTGYSISGLILDYFDKNGGLKKFGYPTGLLTAPSVSGVSQQFERMTIQCDTALKQCKTA